MTSRASMGREHIVAWENLPGYMTCTQDRDELDEKVAVNSIIYAMTPSKLERANVHIFIPVSSGFIQQQLFITEFENRHFSVQSDSRHQFVMKIIELSSQVYICWVQFSSDMQEPCKKLALDFQLCCQTAEVHFEIEPARAEPLIQFIVPQQANVLYLAPQSRRPSESFT